MVEALIVKKVVKLKDLGLSNQVIRETVCEELNITDKEYEAGLQTFIYFSEEYLKEIEGRNNNERVYN